MGRPEGSNPASLSIIFSKVLLSAAPLCAIASLSPFVRSNKIFRGTLKSARARASSHEGEAARLNITLLLTGELPRILARAPPRAQFERDSAVALGL